MKSLLARILTFFAVSCCFGGFLQKPTVSLVGGKANIAFSLDAPTDVEVAVLDASGKIIRHLVAGVLGGATPPPSPLIPGLSQNIPWDGMDDGGKPAVGGPFSTRVRLGVRPVFERSISTKVFPATSSYYQWDYSTLSNVRWNADYLDPDHTVLKRIWGCYPGTCQHRQGGLDIAVSDATNELFIKVYKYDGVYHARVDGLTGAFKNIFQPRFPATNQGRLTWGEAAISWDGTAFYHSSGFDEMFRFDLAGNVSPWPGSGKVVFSGLPQGKQHSRGEAGGPDGSLYVLHNLQHFIAESSAVSRIAPDGNLSQRELIRMYTEGGGGVKVDPQGNIFVGAMLKPKGEHWPQSLTPLMPPIGGAKAAKTESSQPWSTRSPHWWAFALYGSVLKFSPSGGSVMPDAAGDMWIKPNSNLFTATTAKVTGLKGMYYGMSHIGHSRNMNYGAIMCVCNVTRFDVDRFGRVFLPDGFRLSVVGLDNNMNESFRLRNGDVTQPIGYIHQLEVTDQALYGADWYNNQIVVFALKAQAEESVGLPLTVSRSGLINPEGVALSHFPNPALSSATFEWRLPKSGEKTLHLGIFDLSGKLVKQFAVNGPLGKVIWDGRDGQGAQLAAGVYYYRFLDAGIRGQGKMIFGR